MGDFEFPKQFKEQLEKKIEDDSLFKEVFMKGRQCGDLINKMQFKGSGDYIKMPDNEDWNLGSGDFSVSANIKDRAESSKWKHIVVSRIGTKTRLFVDGLDMSFFARLKRFALKLSDIHMELVCQAAVAIAFIWLVKIIFIN